MLKIQRVKTCWLGVAFTKVPFVDASPFTQAPPIDGKEWEQANLGPVRDFLRQQRDLGNYMPTIPIGLD